MRQKLHTLSCHRFPESPETRWKYSTESARNATLLGLNLAEPPAFALVLIGDEYLLGTLRLRQHRSLFSRIAFQVNLGPWTAPLVAEYLQQSLAAVGITRPAIQPAALNLLTSACSGLARSLCLLARAAWIQAASAGAQTIQPPHVQAAIEQAPVRPVS